MLLKLLAALDFLSAATLILLHLDFVGFRVGFIFGLYLIGKGVVFKGDLVSLIDIVIGIYLIIVALFNLHLFITFLVAAYLLQKVVFSLF